MLLGQIVILFVACRGQLQHISGKCTEFAFFFLFSGNRPFSCIFSFRIMAVILYHWYSFVPSIMKNVSHLKAP